MTVSARRATLQSGPLAAMVDDIRAYHRLEEIPIFTMIMPEQEPEYRRMPDFWAVEKYASLKPAQDELGSIVKHFEPVDRLFIRSPQ